MKCPFPYQNLCTPNPTQTTTQQLLALNSLLSHLTRAHRHAQALHLFTQIHSSPHLTPDHYTLASTLTASAHLRSLPFGLQLHSLALRSGLLSFAHVSNSLLSFYSKSHTPTTTRRLFDSIPNPDVYSYTTLLSCYTKSGQFRNALKLFDEIPQRNAPIWNALISGLVDQGYQEYAIGLFLRMHREGVGFDRCTFSSVFGLCGDLELVWLGKQVHSVVVRGGGVGFGVSVVNSLATFYFDCGLVGDGCDVFREAVVRDEITYNVVIAGLVRWGRDEEALEVFKEMKLEDWHLRPNELTFLSVLSACSSKGIGEQVQAQAIRMGLEGSIFVGNVMLTMYSSCGNLVGARQVFESMDERDIVSWNSMISSCSQGNCYELAVELYCQMLRDEIEADEFTYGSLVSCARVGKHVDMIHALVAKDGFISSAQFCNAMISAYAKCGEKDSASHVFVEMSSRNLISWNSIISGCVLNGFPMEGLRLFSGLLRSGLKPNSYTLSTMLSTCGTISAIRHGEQVHTYIIRYGFDSEISVGNALITMYAKCGDLNCSSRVFHAILERDVVSWNAIIAAYSHNADGREAICYFKAMRKYHILPDDVTFTIILSACSHGGLVEEGRLVFSSMVKDYGIDPRVDHYACIIDLLGRAGHLEEAEKIIDSMPYRVNSHIWWTLLSACNTHGNVRLGRIAARFLQEAEPENPAIYVLLSNIIASGEKWGEASIIREQMRSNGVKKNSGCSWI